MHGMANHVRTALAWSARRGAVLLAVGIFGGVLFPPLAAAFKAVITPTVVLLMVLVLLRVDLVRTLAHVRRPARALSIVATLALASPLVCWLVLWPLPVDPSIAAAIVIFATGPAATSSPAFARMVGLDADLSLVATLAMVVIVPFTAPLIALELLGIDLSLSTGEFMLRLLLVVGLPAVLALGVRRAAGRARLAEWGEAVDGAVVWLVVLYGFAVMDGLSLRVAQDPAWVTQAIAAAFVANYGLNALTTLAFARWGVPEAAAAGLMGGNRNMALYLAVLPASTDPRIILFFGLCQFPLFLSPFLLRPAYRLLLGGRQADGRSNK